MKKKKEITKYENGACVLCLMREFQLAKSTITTISKKKEVIKGANVAKSVVYLSPQQSQVLEEVEKLLMMWLGERKCTYHNFDITL